LDFEKERPRLGDYRLGASARPKTTLSSVIDNRLWGSENGQVPRLAIRKTQRISNRPIEKA